MAQTIQGHYRNNNWLEKVVQRKWAWLLVILALYSFPLFRSLQRELPPEKASLGEFAYFKGTVNQFGKVFDSASLEGKAYIVSYFHTQCAPACSNLVTSLKTLQKRIRGLREKSQILSFSIKPQQDTPETLIKYAKNMKVNPLTWQLLTGDKSKILDTLKQAYQLEGRSASFSEKALLEGIDQQKFILVDQRGKVRGFYKMNEQGMDNLVTDMGLIVNLGKSYYKKDQN